MKAFSLVELLLSVAIFSIGLAGTMNGYLLASQRLYYLSCSQAANNSASQRLEQVRAAKWDNQVVPVTDEVVITNFLPQVVLLDMPVSGNNSVFATNYTDILVINPNLKFISVSCVWQHRNFQLFTNTIETYIGAK